MSLDHDNLDAFKDAEAYDHQDTSDTGLTFYAALAHQLGSPVLDLACGTGRIGIPIARQGFSVTGLDLVPDMIQQARRKSQGLTMRWVVGDVRALHLDQHFRLIFMTGNAFQLLLTNQDQEAMLHGVRVHLAPDGLWAFETRNPRWPGSPDLQQAPGGFFELNSTRESLPVVSVEDGREIRESAFQTYDHVAQVLHLTSFKRWGDGADVQEEVTRLALRYTFPQELVALLGRCGFIVEQQYGNWDRSAVTASSPSIITVCRASA